MKKLEDIPKKNIFEVPEGYFDRLPGVIQSRVAEDRPKSAWTPYVRLSLRYALPVVVAGLALLYYLSPQAQSAEEMLASLDTQDLVAYLEDTDLTTDDLLENISIDDEDADALRSRTFELDEIDLDKLSDEIGVDYF